MMNSEALLNHIQHDIVAVRMVEESLSMLMGIALRYQNCAPTDDDYSTMVLIEKMRDINGTIEDTLVEMHKRRNALNMASVEESDRVVELAEKKYNDIY